MSTGMNAVSNLGSNLGDLAKRLSDTTRLGLSAELAERLKLRSEDVVRGQLMAITDGDRGPLGVYLLAPWLRRRA